MSLYKRFIEFSEKEKLFNKKSKVLIALSGGIDSVVLLHLLHSLGLKTGVAHCNFMLRENESDEDEIFCKNTAQKYNVDFYCKHFETVKYAKEHRVSIQMAARELRYEWLEDTRINNGYDLIATGAHFDDSIETFFINLSRGSGIAGLTGIKPKNNKVIRPLLFAAKVDVLAYAKKNRLKFREDSSNQSDKYQRNALRNKIIPVFEQYFPAFKKSVSETISLLGNSEKIIDDFLEQKRELLTQKISSGIIIDKKLLKNEKHKQPILYEFISTYGFNKHQTEDIIRSINSTETQIFYSKEYGLIVDRLQITVSIKKTEAEINLAVISENQIKIKSPLNLSFKRVPAENYQILQQKNIAQLDFDKLKFPLLMRKWESGDSFVPLGMNKKKKISDFITDMKLTAMQKKNTYVLISGDEIIWVVGERISEKFKVKNNTKHVYLIKLGNGNKIEI